MEPDDDFDIDVEKELGTLVEDAVNFIDSTFAEDWSESEKYYSGDSGVQKVENRSQVTATVLRDLYRAALPSILRVFTQTPNFVEYKPNGARAEALAHQQTNYVNQLFWRLGGYGIIRDSFNLAALKKYAVVMSWSDTKQAPKYVTVTNLLEAQLELIQQNYPSISIISAEQSGQYVAPEGAIQLYTAELMQVKETSELHCAVVPNNSFFIDEHATGLGIGEFTVCGHRESLTVSDAVAMGLSAEDLEGLDNLEPDEAVASEEADLRRGYNKAGRIDSLDPSMRRVLITTVYARYDLEGTGIAQLYKFLLGGTSYFYLTHERVSEVPYDIITIDPQPDTWAGRSLHDVLKEDQDTQTSLLRATCDNAHLANNKRLAYHETMVNGNDIQNNALGAPIRFRAPGMIQEIGVQSSIGAMLPLLQHLNQGSQLKVGVTNAGVGLDPDALQSTTKEGVENTINLSQGQIEVMARNMAEGFRSVANKLLKLSMWNLDRQQLIEVNGEIVEVDQAFFDPTLHMEATVGLGTNKPEIRIAGLTSIYQEQKTLFQQLGPLNPLVTLKHMHNTLTDIAKEYGIHNVSRYFANLTPEQDEAARKQLAQAQAESTPVDAGKALIQSEQVKAEIKRQELILTSMLEERRNAVERQFEAHKFVADDDFRRDKLAQELYAQNRQGENVASGDRSKVHSEQNNPRATPLKGV